MSLVTLGGRAREFFLRNIHGWEQLQNKNSRANKEPINKLSPNIRANRSRHTSCSPHHMIGDIRPWRSAGMLLESVASGRSPSKIPASTDSSRRRNSTAGQHDHREHHSSSPTPPARSIRQQSLSSLDLSLLCGSALLTNAPPKSRCSISVLACSKSKITASTLQEMPATTALLRSVAVA